MPVIDDIELPEAPDESGEETVLRLMARYNLNRAVCYEMITEVMEALAPCGGPSFGGEDALRKLEAKQRQAWHILVAYQANQKTPEQMIMSTRCMALELGYSTVAGADCPAALGRLLGIKKQTVDKCMKNFRTKLGLPERPGQRDETARANMAKARTNQLNRGDAEARKKQPPKV